MKYEIRRAHYWIQGNMPFELAMRRKTGFASTYWLCSFYGAYRASWYFQNNPLPAPLFRWKKSKTGKWHEVPEWAMRFFQPFNTYKKTMRGESFMRGTKAKGERK